MQFIGLAGRAGSGKDTVADYLIEKYGFVKFSFSDALYDEVQKAFGLKDQSLLRDRDSKEVRSPRLMPANCRDGSFSNLATKLLHVSENVHAMSLLLTLPLSPRWILQTWGTEYRRAQDPDYWVKRAALFVTAFKETADPDTCGGLVNTSVRFPNEVEYVRSQNGMIWHIMRGSLPKMDNSGHVSEVPVPFMLGKDKEIRNNSTIERLRTGISLLYTSGANRIWVEDDAVTSATE